MKISPMLIWKGLQNARLFTMIGGSMQRLVLDGSLLQIHKIWKLARKLYLSSQIQNLTLFYPGLLCNLSALYSTNLCKLLFITLSGVFYGK